MNNNFFQIFVTQHTPQKYSKQMLNHDYYYYIIISMNLLLVITSISHKTMILIKYNLL